MYKTMILRKPNAEAIATRYVRLLRRNGKHAYFLTLRADVVDVRTWGGLISDPAVRPQFAALRNRNASEAAIGAAKVVLL